MILGGMHAGNVVNAVEVTFRGLCGVCVERAKRSE
jgi:hypothetical protein